MGRNEVIAFLVEYKCKDVVGRSIVVAYNAKDALNWFFNL